MNIARWSAFLKDFEHEIILSALCLVAIAFSLLNPLWYGGAPGFDASLFVLIGKMWAGGEILYQDMIDIKGPGIFFIDLLGYRLGGYAGVAFLETIFLVFGVISVDLAMRIFKFTPLSRFCSITTVISLLGLRYYYGNMTEDYALYFAMICSYPYALLFYRRRFYWRLSILPALLFGFTLSIRVNNVSYMLAWYTMLFLFYCANGRLLDGFKLIFTAVLGFLVVFASFSYYFFSIGGGELLNQAFYYSIGIFFVDGAYGSPGLNLFAGTVGFFRTGLFIVIIGFVWLLFSKDNNLINEPKSKYNDRFWFLLYMIFGIFMTIVANSASGHIYDHYDELFLAFMFIPLAFLMHRYLHVKKDIHISFLTIMFLLVFLISERILFGQWNHRQVDLLTVVGHTLANILVATVICTTLFIARKRIGFYHHYHTFFLCLSIGIALMLGCYAVYLGPRSGLPWDEETQIKVDFIKNNTEPTERIWVEGDMPQFYVWTDRLPTSAFLYFSNVNEIHDLKTRILNGINYFKPRFIVIRSRLVEAYLKDKANSLAYNSSERAFFEYVFNFYDELMPGLYVRKTEKNQLDLTPILAWRDRQKQELKDSTKDEISSDALSDEAKENVVLTPVEEVSEKTEKLSSEEAVSLGISGSTTLPNASDIENSLNESDDSLNGEIKLAIPDQASGKENSVLSVNNQENITITSVPQNIDKENSVTDQQPSIPEQTDAEEIKLN